MKNFADLLQDMALLIGDSPNEMISSSVKNVISNFSKTENDWAAALKKKNVSDRDIDSFIAEMRWQVFGVLAAKAASNIDISQAETAYTILKYMDADSFQKSKDLLSSILGTSPQKDNNDESSLFERAKTDDHIN